MKGLGSWIKCCVHYLYGTNFLQVGAHGAEELVVSYISLFLMEGSHVRGLV